MVNITEQTALCSSWCIVADVKWASTSFWIRFSASLISTVLLTPAASRRHVLAENPLPLPVHSVQKTKRNKPTLFLGGSHRHLRWKYLILTVLMKRLFITSGVCQASASKMILFKARVVLCCLLCRTEYKVW